MPLRIYNTLAGEKELFTPIHDKNVSIYVCGITTYNYCHIGHARAMIVFDVVSREFRRRGYHVTFVRNYTDVDDKIIRRAHDENTSSDAIADRFVAATREDMLHLGCLSPTFEPRVTQHISDIIGLVQTLVDKGHAYASEGDVYFSVPSYAAYGALSKQNLNELQLGSRNETAEQKSSELDFALWKSSKPGEPAWPSPWGLGRPGWHIECSAMCAHYLGNSFDIHGGGSDLIFPHHENEIAQSEAATGNTLARYWMHNGMLTVNREKMSKSLNNFFTIRDCLQRFHFETIRLYLLNTHYRSPKDYHDSGLEEAEVGLEHLYQALSVAEAIVVAIPGSTLASIHALWKSDQLYELAQIRPWETSAAPYDLPMSRWTKIELEILTLVKESFVQIEEALDDDFNTARAIGYLFELARSVGRLAAIQKKHTETTGLALGAAAALLFEFGRNVLGILTIDAESFRDDLNIRRLQGRSISIETIQNLIAERAEARNQRNWPRSDAIRDQLAAQGVLLEDSPKGTTWRVEARTFAANDALPT